MKHLLIIPGLLAIAACSASPEQNFAKAKSEFAAHDYNAARLHLANSLAASPNDKAMLLLQAKTLIALGDGDGAGTALASLAGIAPPTGEVAELSAEAALLRQVPEVALAMLGEANSAEAERLRALAAIQKRDLPGALGHFEKALKAGGNPRVFADYARFKLMSGDMGGAEAMAERAAKAAPNGLDTLLIGGQLAVRHGDLALALDKYHRASQLYPASLAAITGKAAVLGDLGRTQEMKQVLDRAITFAPGDPTVVYLRAKAGIASKDWAGVKALIQTVESKLKPTDPLRQFYGEALHRLGQNDLAIAQLTPIARVQPGNRQVVLLLAEAQLATGDAPGAVATLRPLANQPIATNEELVLMAKAAQAAGDPGASGYEARSRQPAVQSLGHDVADADAAMRAGNWAGAVASYRRILAVTDGQNVVVLNNMAYAQLMLGNSAEANEFASRALKLAPNNPSVLDTAGWAQFKSGKDVATAKRLLRKAVEQAPANMTIRAHLAEAERAPG